MLTEQIMQSTSMRMVSGSSLILRSAISGEPYAWGRPATTLKRLASRINTSSGDCSRVSLNPVVGMAQEVAPPPPKREPRPEFEKVTIERDDGKVTFDAYVLGDRHLPGIIVLQEWWGVDYEVKNHAAFVAKKGFRTLIPDLYRGRLGLDEAEAQHLMSTLDWPGAVEDIRASVKWLKKHGSPKVGVTGFCMGGALTLASAVLVEGISAAVSFYGIPPKELADVTKVKVPVQAHFGEADKITGFSDLESAKALQEKLTASGVTHEVHLYPDVGHAFMASSKDAIKRKEDSGFGDHDARAVETAWSRFDAWFNKFLKAEEEE